MSLSLTFPKPSSILILFPGNKWQRNCQSNKSCLHKKLSVSQKQNFLTDRKQHMLKKEKEKEKSSSYPFPSPAPMTKSHQMQYSWPWGLKSGVGWDLNVPETSLNHPSTPTVPSWQATSEWLRGCVGELGSALLNSEALPNYRTFWSMGFPTCTLRNWQTDHEATSCCGHNSEQLWKAKCEWHPNYPKGEKNLA